jgi:condensin-2 complex subunit H2
MDMMLSKQTKKSKLKESVDPNGADTDAPSEEDFLKDGSKKYEFLPLDDKCLKECNSDMIDLKEDQEVTRIGQSSPLSRLKQSLLLNKFKFDDIKKRSFKSGFESLGLSSCNVHESGALYFEEGDHDLLDQSFRNHTQAELNSSTVEDDPLTNNDVDAFDAAQDAGLNQNLAPVEDIEQVDFAHLDDNEDDFEDEVVNLNGSNVTDESNNIPKKNVVSSRNISRSVNDEGQAWIMLDAYAASSNQSKQREFKRSKSNLEVSFKLSSIKKKEYNLLSLFLPPTSIFLNQKRIHSSSLFLPYFSEFDEYAKTEGSRRKDIWKKISGSTSVEEENFVEVGLLDVLEDDECFNANTENDNFEYNEHQTQDNATVFPSEWKEAQGFAVEEDLDDGFDDDFVYTQEESSQEKNEKQMTYEERCRLHVEEYIKKAESFAEQSALSKRVKEWESKMSVLLADQEKHPEFDIREYGELLINRVQKSKSRNPKSKKVLAVSSFENAVSGLPQYDICRYFLATLQLANYGNVNLVKNASDQSLSIELLSSDLAKVPFE